MIKYKVGLHCAKTISSDLCNNFSNLLRRWFQRGFRRPHESTVWSWQWVKLERCPRDRWRYWSLVPRLCCVNCSPMSSHHQLFHCSTTSRRTDWDCPATPSVVPLPVSPSPVVWLASVWSTQLLATVSLCHAVRAEWSSIPESNKDWLQMCSNMIINFNYTIISD